MSNWTTITEADLLARKMAPLMRALRTAALATGQSDPVDEISADMVQRVRTKIASCATNTVDEDATTVPVSLKALVCRMIIREAKGRLEMPLTEDERKQMDVDERDLTAIAACNLVVEQPDTAITPEVQVVQPGPVISARARRFSREQQDGA